MSWSYNKTGRASKLAEVVKDGFASTGDCPAGSAEEAAKNALGDVAAALCGSLAGDKVCVIEASGSAWNNQDGTANSQACQFKFSTVGDFIE
ncbi:MAG TPA: hypothetical protein VM639_24340 [Dongiaceae bacterium]|nr:hypothetical protein [Dongiaceae bacterium]